VIVTNVQAAHTLFYAVRTTGDPMAMVPSVVNTVQKLDPDVPVYDVESTS
jgi:hypothetical protein